MQGSQGSGKKGSTLRDGQRPLAWASSLVGEEGGSTLKAAAVPSALSALDIDIYPGDDINILCTWCMQAVAEACRPSLMSNKSDICGYENEECEAGDGPVNMNNRKHWGQPFMEASCNVVG